MSQHLTGNYEYDRIEIIGDFRILQVRKALVITNDDNNDEIVSRTFSRYTLTPGTLGANNQLIDNPLAYEADGSTAIPVFIKNICQACWTSEIKQAYREYLINNAPPIEN